MILRVIRNKCQEIWCKKNMGKVISKSICESEEEQKVRKKKGREKILEWDYFFFRTNQFFIFIIYHIIIFSVLIISFMINTSISSKAYIHSNMKVIHLITFNRPSFSFPFLIINHQICILSSCHATIGCLIEI